MDPAIEITDLWQGYRARAAVRRRRLGFRHERETHWALRSIGIRIERGELFGVVGPNGAGKSTLLASVAGVLPPSRGVVSVAGRVAPVLVPQSGPHRDLTGAEHLLIAGVLIGCRRRELREGAEAIGELAGLDRALLDQPMRTYSAGMIARLEFALAIWADASVLVLDEHLAAVDESFRGRLENGLRELAAGGGTAVIASHELESIAGLCDRLALLDRGELVTVGPPGRVLAGYEEIRVESDSEAPAAERHAAPAGLRLA